MTQNKFISETHKLEGVRIEKTEMSDDPSIGYIYVRPYKKFQRICPHCGRKCASAGVASRERKWRALDDGPTQIFLVYDLHRISCPEHGVITESVPWAFHDSKFTKTFEQQVAWLALRNSKKDVCLQMRINWRTVGNIVQRVQEVKEKDPSSKYDNLEVIGIDETSYRKGHTYLTTVVNQKTGEVIWAAPGFGKKVLESFFDELTPEQTAKIRLVCADGARWIRSTVHERAPQALFCIDPFHVVSWAVDALDSMRRQAWRSALDIDKSRPKRGRGRPKKSEDIAEKKSIPLKNSKYALGKNPENLTEKQMERLAEIKEVYPVMFRGYQLKEALRNVFHTDQAQVESALKHWLDWACRCRIPEFVELSKKIRRHKDSILNTLAYGVSTSRVESLNNKIKLIIRRAYGFANTGNLISMIKLVCSSIGRDLQPAYSMDPDFA